MTMTSAGWLWLYIGAGLMMLEVVSCGFVVFFFGLAAATVGLMRFCIGDEFTLTWQLVAFSALCVAYIALLRRWVKGVFSGKIECAVTDFDNEYIGRVGRVTAEICPPLAGRVVIGDAEWTAVADEPIAVGADVKVVYNKNLTMKVEEMK